MKKIIGILLLAAIYAANSSVFSLDRICHVPQVEYISPKNDSTIDLTQQDEIVFKWKPLPKPSSGRMYYKFILYKSFGYDQMESAELPSDCYQYKVSKDKFQDGQTCTWNVKQRAQFGGNWSIPETWSFKVKK